MGSKGSGPTVTNTAQTYTANPQIQGAANQAIAGAQSAAAQPFQMPVAPVAGFNPTQQQAFGQYGQLQNSWQPAFAQGEGYTAQSAAPVTAADVNNVYNPMAGNVTAQLQNIYGEQNVQNQGNLTAQAGGVGADRIAVGMGDLANQQTLGAGQVYSNLYQQALQTAMQQKQLQAGAGAQFQAFGTGTLGNNIQGTNALLGAGNQQQQQTQAQLNAPYQNQLAQIAYQFQTPQYLAGIAGGLAPALGGTTQGTQVTQPPQPSLMSQILGLGTAGVGAYGAFGGFGGANAGSAQNPMTSGAAGPTLTAADYQGYGPGGNWTTPFGYAEGGEVDQPPPFPGTSLPKMGGAEPIPYTSLPMGGGHSGPLTGGINTAPTHTSSGTGETVGGDISQALNIASKVAPFLMERGGATGYDDGGTAIRGPQGVGENVSDWAANQNLPTALEGSNLEMNPLGVNAVARIMMGVSGSPNARVNEGHRIMRERTIPHYDDGGDVNDPDSPSYKPYTWGRLGSDIMGMLPHSAPAAAQTAPPASFNDRFGAAFPNAAPNVTKSPPPQPGPPIRLDPAATAKWRKGVDDDEDIPAKTAASSGPYPATAQQSNPYITPQAQLPYPDSLERDTGQQVARSPWLALMKAGAAMASTPGPLGVSVAKGIQAGVGSVENQRKELRSEQELNDKAQKLYQDAQVHLDKYNKMTPYEAGSLAARNKEIDQSASDTGTGPPKEIDIQRIINGMNNSLDPKYMKMTLDEKRAAAVAMLRPGSATAAPPNVGTEKQFDDGKGGTVTGIWDGTKWVPKP